MTSYTCSTFQKCFLAYFRGKLTASFKVITWAPLSFSFDILSSVFQYGNRCLTKYAEGMTDYFKEAYPAGMSFERKCEGYCKLIIYLVIKQSEFFF